jgi:hypothetical protein
VQRPVVVVGLLQGAAEVAHRLFGTAACPVRWRRRVLCDLVCDKLCALRRLLVSTYAELRCCLFCSASIARSMRDAASLRTLLRGGCCNRLLHALVCTSPEFFMSIVDLHALYACKRVCRIRSGVVLRCLHLPFRPCIIHMYTRRCFFKAWC